MGKTVQTTIQPRASLIDGSSTGSRLVAGDYAYVRVRVVGFAEGSVIVKPVTKKRDPIGDAVYYVPPEAVPPVGAAVGEMKGKM